MFVTGQKVTTNNHMTKKYGMGPFLVVATRFVPSEDRERVGHHQWVTVETSKGEITLPGVFFNRAPKS